MTARRARAVEKGVSLLEVVIAVAISSFLFASIGTMIGISLLMDKAAEDLTRAEFIAQAKVDELHRDGYDQLVLGGSLATDVDGFNDSEDVDGDGRIDFTRRWQVTQQGALREIAVLAEPTSGAVFGAARPVTSRVLVGDNR